MSTQLTNSLPRPGALLPRSHLTMVGPFKEGAVISAHTMNSAVPFNLTITSPGPVARGSTADVYEGELAVVGRTPRRVALKVFTHKPAGENLKREARQQLIRRELRAARQVKHPRIIAILGVAAFKSHTILISPFMANGCMLKYLRQHSTADRNALVIQVAEAVDHLHTVHNLVHGDIKCENVLISDEGTALLADFGLSTFPRKEGENCASVGLYHMVAKGGVRLGSPGRGGRHSTTLAEVRLRFTAAFAGPELLFAENPKLLPSKSTYLDVYAFGMLVLQAFTGKSPWKGHSFQSIVLKVYSGTIHPRPGPEASERGLIDAWWRVCLNCLEYDPEQRPTMRQVWTELQLTLDAHVRGLKYLASLNQGPLHQDGSLFRTGMLMVLLSSEHGRQWLIDRKVELFDRMHAEALAHYAAAPRRTFRLSAEFRLFQSFFDQSSYFTSPALLPLSLTLGTSHRDVFYDSFPFEFPFSRPEPVCTLAIVGRDLIATGLDSLRVWNMRSGAVLRNSTLPGSVSSRAIYQAISAPRIPRSPLFATASTCSIRLWTVAPSGLIQTGPVMHTGARGSVCSLAVSADAFYVVAGFEYGEICVWDALRGRKKNGITSHHARSTKTLSRRVNALAFALDGLMLASGSDDGTVGLYAYCKKSQSFEPFGSALRVHNSAVLSVAYAQDGRSVVSGSRDGTLRLWDVNSCREKLAMKGHSGPILSVAFAPTGRHVASASQDTTVRIWSARSGDAVCVLRGHASWVRSVIFSPDGTRVVSGSDDGAVRVWDSVILADYPGTLDDDVS